VRSTASRILSISGPDWNCRISWVPPENSTP
jgi:hypothetical protein